MKKIKLLPILLFAGIAIFATSCKREGCTDETAINYNADAKKDDGSCQYEGLPEVNVTMKHSVDGSELQFDQVLYTNAAGNEYEVTKLVYFISDIRFNKADDTGFSIEGIKYVDAEDPLTMNWATGKELPEGNYISVSFVVGITNQNNISGMFSSLPESNMEWPANNGGGYHYMKLEQTSDGNPYLTHHGPTAGIDFSSTLTIPFAQALKINKADNKSKLNITLDMNINNWYNDPVYDFTVWGSAIMMNLNAQQALKDNTGDLFEMNYTIE